MAIPTPPKMKKGSLNPAGMSAEVKKLQSKAKPINPAGAMATIKKLKGK